MIVPHIHVDESNIRELDALAERWGVLGRLAISGVQSGQLDPLTALLEKTAGDIDIQIELVEPELPTALQLLNAGASEIQAAVPAVRQLVGSIPPERLISVCERGEQVVAGTAWLASNGSAAVEYATCNPAARVQVRDLAQQVETVSELDRSWIDCLIDVADLSHNPDFIGDVIARRLQSDRSDGLWPTLIVDRLGMSLGLAYSNSLSLHRAITRRTGIYWSRSRNEIWEKGKTSGATQRLIRIDLDCDRDCLQFTVDQEGPGFCHRGHYSCFGRRRTIQTVTHRLLNRIQGADQGSFTRKLVNDPELLRRKLVEEANELADTREPDEVAWEAADLLYFSLVRMVETGVGLDRVFAELSRRLNRVVRRPNKLEQQDGTR